MPHVAIIMHMASARKRSVLAIPDLHFPWAYDIRGILAVAEEMQPDVIVQLGDIYDLFSYSRFARLHDICTPEEELGDAVSCARVLWDRLARVNPRSRKIQLRGNHDIRILKTAIERAPELYSIVSRHEGDLWKFPGVETILCDKTGVEIDDVLYVHGWLTKLGDHMRSLGKNVVHGHTHRSGVLVQQLAGKQLFELDCGYWADGKAVPLRYGPGPHINWVRSLGWVDKHGPRLILP